MPAGPPVDQPLAGCCILIPRAQEQSGALVAAITASGGLVWEFPVAQILNPLDWSTVDTAAQRLHQFAWVAFTSANGVDMFMSRVQHLSIASPAASGVRCAAVGKATAAALARWGLPVALQPERPDAESLAAALAATALRNEAVLVVRPEHPAYDVAGHLRRAGLAVSEATAYRVGPGDGDAAALRAALAAGQIHYAAITSPSFLAMLVAELGGPAWLQEVRLACIGPKTAAAVRSAGLSVAVVAAEPGAGLLAAAMAADAATLR